MIQNASTTLSCKVNDYIDYVSVKNETFRIQNKVICLEDALKPVLELYRCQAQAKQLKFEVLTKNLPSHVEVDK